MKTDKPKILVVDDKPANLLAMQKALQKISAEVITAQSGNEALSLLLRHQFAVILLDVNMPNMDGFETAELILQIEETKNTPIIFVTASDKNEQSAFQGYASGAVDYLYKPIDQKILLSKVNVFLKIYTQNIEIINNRNELENLLRKESNLLQTVKAKNIKLQKYFSIFICLMCFSFISTILLIYSYSQAKQNGQLAIHAKQLKDLNIAYKRFVPSEFLDLLEKSSISDIKFGDQIMKSMWVMFTDVRDYTTITEHLSPKDNIALLNTIFSVIQPPIQEHGGIINKHLGDGLMALFPKGADDAVNAAIKIQNNLRIYNESRIFKNLRAIRLGIGIDGGEVVLGTVGQQDRMETTVISDVVVSASRIEGITKIYGTNILISNTCAKALKNPENFSLRKIDKVLMKGKSKTVTIMHVLNGEHPKIQALLEKQSKQFFKARELFKNKNFILAKNNFQKLYSLNKDDIVSCLYAKRCDNLVLKQKNGALKIWPEPTNVLLLDPCSI